MVSSTVGSATKTGWKRRASAASFSTCLRYSSSVVAPTQCSSPRASAGFSRLEASIAPSALPAPTSVCISSMNRMIWPLRGLDLRQHGFQPLLELAAIFGAGDQRAEIEREHLLVLEALRHVALDDAVRQPLDDRRLADARLADQHRIVLGAARQHLDGAADLLVAADHRIELALGGGLGEVAGIFLERVVSLLGASRVRGAALAQLVDRGIEPLRRQPGIGKDALRLAPLCSWPAPGAARSTVTKLSPALLAICSAWSSMRDNAGDSMGLRRRRRPRPWAAWRAPHRCACSACLALPPARCDETGRHALGIVEQRLEQVLGRNLRVAVADRKRLRGLDEAFEPVGEFIEIHGLLSLL